MKPDELRVLVEARIRVSAESVPLLDELNQHVINYNIHGAISQFNDIASDCFDGAYFREELEDLVRRRLLTIVHYGYDDSLGRDPNRERDRRLCGTVWSVNPTERLIASFWPDRIASALASTPDQGETI